MDRDSIDAVGSCPGAMRKEQIGFTSLSPREL